MDKITGQSWDLQFRNNQHEVVYQHDRYQEIISHYSEPGLASVKLQTVQTSFIHFIRAKFEAEKNLIIEDPDDMESVSSSFVLSGNLQSNFLANKSAVKHSSNTQGFQYTPNFRGNHILHKSVDAVSLFYDLAFFRNLAASSENNYMEKVLNCMERKETLLIAPGEILLQPKMTEILHQITSTSFVGLTKYLFIESKLLELLALQIEQFNIGKTAKDVFTARDKDTLHEIFEFLNENYLETQTLSGICRTFGMNEFKLKKGFKSMFGKTVFGHIQDLKMNKASELLTSEYMNVSEVSLHMGYQNISSFSEAFKKKFGYLPSALKIVK